MATPMPPSTLADADPGREAICSPGYAREVLGLRCELAAYKAALDQHAIVAATDRAGRITHVNELFCRTSGYSKAELIGANHRIVNSGVHPRSFFRTMWTTIVQGRPWHGEVCNRARQGALYWVDTTIVPLKTENGVIRGFVSIRYEITERKRAEAALAEENRKRAEAESLLREVIDALPDGVAAFDPEDRLILFNAAYRDLYGAAAPREGMRFEEILENGLRNGLFPRAGATPEMRRGWFERRLLQHRNPGMRLIEQLGDGRWVQVQERIAASGRIVGVRTDITELKQAELTIKTQAEQDPLTGLANRAVLIRRLERLLSDRRPRAGALVLLDLDDFKHVNDTLGHDAGDELLQVIAARLRRGLRKGDTVARLGGDEFGIILPALARLPQAERLLARIAAGLGEPVRVGHRTIVPRFSIGLARYPQDGSTPKELLKSADIALYRAKASERGGLCVFKAEMREALEEQQAMADRLRAAVTHDAFEIVLQPQRRLGDGSHFGFEALVRWRHEGRAMAPAQFIPVAEETGLIVPIGDLVVGKALAAMRSLRDRGLDPGQLAINVAAAQLRDPDFANRLRSCLAAHAFEPAAVEIEVTENVLLDRAAGRIGETLEALHAMGVTIALDDFGTGYASLAHLNRFPVDRLKIDRSFVAGIGAGTQDAVIVRTVINLAHSLGFEVVAEGIETEAHREFLASHGCDIGQGYLFGKPMSLAEAGAYLAGCGGAAGQRCR